MHIYIETGNHWLSNHGDAAMYMIMAERIHRLMPEAQLSVLTSDPARLHQLTPYVNPIVTSYASHWNPLKQIVDRFLTHDKLVPLRTWLRHQAKQKSGDFQRVAAQASAEADHLMYSGTSVMCDIFADEALRRLNAIQNAKQAGKAVSLMSQAFGPIDSPKLIEKSREVLPSVDFIGIRETVYSKPLLHEWGLDNPKQVHFTSDDGLELAYIHKAETLGPKLGMNVRFGPYSSLSNQDKTTVRVIRETLAKFQLAKQIIFPISEDDMAATSAVIDQPLPDYHADYAIPLDVIQAIGECRVVFTGSYHGAVFALAQGISAVCLINSAYYWYKFSGLCDQFPAGCDLVDLRQGDVTVAGLTQILNQAWDRAPDIRPALLNAAANLVTQGQQAYQVWHQMMVDDPSKSI